MTEQEIVDRVEAVYQSMQDNANEPNYYHDLKKKVLSIYKEVIEGKDVGLHRFQKIHLNNWVCNLINSCEFALLIKEDPTMHDVKRIMLQEMISDLLRQSHKNFNFFKNLKTFLKTND